MAYSWARDRGSEAVVDWIVCSRDDGCQRTGLSELRNADCRKDKRNWSE